MSRPKTLCCQPDPRETKGRVINPQEHPKTASHRVIRTPYSHCQSLRQRRQKVLWLHNLSVTNLYSKVFPPQLGSKIFLWLFHRCYSQLHTRWEAQRRNRKLIPCSWWSNTIKVLLKDQAFSSGSHCQEIDSFHIEI